MRRRRAALILLVLGALLLCIDVRYRTDIAYPDYEFAENYGAQTQRMIIEDVVGTRLTVDFGSELLGYLSLMISLLIVLSYARPVPPDEKDRKKQSIRFGWKIPRVNANYILWPFFGALLYLQARLMPFLANGVALYGTEYFVNFGLIFAEAAVLLFSTLCFLRECDRFQNHKETQFIYLFLILTVFSGVLKGIAAFYGLEGVRTAYTIVNTITVVVMCITLIHYVRTEDLIARAAKVEKESGKTGAEDVIYFKS